MNDEDALLAAITASPLEETPRLAYADWLEEHQQPIRAEFIRLQCDLARKERLPRSQLNRHVNLFKRQQELIENHRPELLGPLSSLPQSTRVEYRRGFVTEIELPVEDFSDFAAMIAGVRPRPRVSVTAVLRKVVAFLSNPHLEIVTKISGYKPETAFGQSTDDPDLITQGIGRLKNLEILDLEGCAIGDLFWEADLNVSLPALVDLDVSQNDLTDIDVVRFLQTPFPAQLKRFILGGNPIGDQGAIELSDRWPRNHRLEVLNLRFTNIGQAGQQALLSRFGGKVELF